jgi:hypothetical protein
MMQHEVANCWVLGALVMRRCFLQPVARSGPPAACVCHAGLLPCFQLRAQKQVFTSSTTHAQQPGKASIERLMVHC